MNHGSCLIVAGAPNSRMEAVPLDDQRRSSLRARQSSGRGGRQRTLKRYVFVFGYRPLTVLRRPHHAR
eukprot:scaffold55253_cov61-Phaeocystis_antarctica.AAC.7